jgi:hypothetical protein
MRRVIEALEPRPQLRGVDVLLRPAEAAHQDRTLLEAFRHVGPAHDDGHAAVVDQAVVVQAERLRDVGRLHVVRDREGLLHDGIGVQAGVLAERDRHGAELCVGGVVEQLVALEEERVEHVLRRHAPRDGHVMSMRRGGLPRTFRLGVTIRCRLVDKTPIIGRTEPGRHVGRPVAIS